MKSLFSFLLVILISFSAFAQRMLIVDNNDNAPTGSLYFTNLEQAILSVEAGDVILLVPSNSGYEWPVNSVVWDKENYSIVGVGLNTDLDNVPLRGRSIITNEVIIGFDQIPSNVTFDGIVFQGGFTFLNAHNITIKNSEINRELRFSYNRGGGALHGPTTNVIFRNNIMLLTSGLDIEGTVNALVYENNVIFTGADFCDISFATLNHNLIFSTPSSGEITGIENQFNNNIIANYQATSGLTRSVFSYNLYETTLGQNDGSSGEANIITSIDLTTLFDDSRITIGSWNREWNLTSNNSDIIGRAKDGTNIGPTGGNIPFKKIAFSLPVITDLIAPTTFKLGTNPEITVKAKGN